MQQMVGAALVSGIESSGDPTVLSGGVGPAAGLFQFEPQTWISNGGGQFAPVAQQASWQEQVTVFLHASQGDNFGAWGPDLGGSYGYSGPPKPGSAVANKISGLSITPTAQGASFPGGAWDLLNLPSEVGGAVGGATGAASALGSVETLVSDLISPHFWQRVGMGVLGVGVFVVGMVVFFASTDAGKKTISEGEQAATVAAMA